MFAKPSRLRSFVSENGSDVVHFVRKRAVLLNAAYKRSCYSCRTLGFKCNGTVALVQKRVHFFCDNVGRLAYSSQKEFENGRSYFLKTEICRCLSCRVFNVVPFICVLAKNVFRSFWNCVHSISDYKIYFFKLEPLSVFDKCSDTYFSSISIFFLTLSSAS